MLQKTRGIILHQIKYSDHSRIVHIYTELLGRLSFLIRLSHGRKSATAPGLLQPLSLVEMEAYFKPNREIQGIKEMQAAIILSSIPYDIRKRTIALFLGEILYKTLREEEPNPGLFNFLYHAIQLLDTSTTGIQDFHLYFLMQLTKYLGFYPESNWSDSNPYFDMQNGVFVGLRPMHMNYLDANAGKLFHELLIMGTRDLRQSTWTPSQRSGILNNILSFYQFHTVGLENIQSLQILMDVFH
jgi:DNA repair protein RecO (recombination protein O)